MGFNFDVEQAAQKAQNERPTPAKAAKAANPDRSAERISGISNISKTGEWDYTADDLKEIDRRLRELAQLEGWTEYDLEGKLWERRHMAPCNVKKALHALRIAVREALAPWPTPPASRAHVTLCELVAAPRRELGVIDGGKPKKDIEPYLPEAA